ERNCIKGESHHTRTGRRRSDDGGDADGQYRNGLSEPDWFDRLVMHSFHYQRGKLHCESYPLDKAAERYGTPLYVYSSQTIVDHYHRLDQALHELHHEICYAVKANSNLAIIRLLADKGAVFDIFSSA